ncbi:MAG: LysE family transporter [Chromatiaceae bacterium]|nr:LysE family transporter [Chromatiaceae bacterium]MCF8004781.1 LysE family transporter [Chromatiaceae bacterium]
MTPGPSLAVVLGSMLRGGRGAGLAAALAHGLAVGLYTVLTVAGLAALLTASPRLFALQQPGRTQGAVRGPGRRDRWRADPFLPQRQPRRPDLVRRLRGARQRGCRPLRRLDDGMGAR